MNEILRALIHYGIHFGIPVLLAFWLYRPYFSRSLLILWGGILIDIDHLWATPLFDPERCSVGFHTFHQWPFIALYILLLFWRRSRIVGLALVIHIMADLTDCYLMNL